METSPQAFTPKRSWIAVSLPVDLKGGRLVDYPVRSMSIYKANAWDAERGAGSTFIFFFPTFRMIREWPVITQRKNGKVVSVMIPNRSVDVQ